MQMRATRWGMAFVSTVLTIASRRKVAHAFRPAQTLPRSHGPRLLSTLHAGKGKGGTADGSVSKKPKNVFAETILLPETDFSQRANALQREPEIQAFWKEINLYQKLSNKAAESNASRFVLHDGPPYANGDLHCGHALNKILKDFINRKQLLNGKQVHYVPGWDCHGLPIELKVLQTLKQKEREKLTPVTLREKAADFAKDTVEKQSKSFQQYGIFGDFDHPYLTLQPSFEAAQIKVFGKMFTQGFIFRGRKPVHWSPSSKTALAEAELEYPEGHVSKSIYVGFTVHEPSPALAALHSSEDPIRVAIWTTTPWTMPANLAVAVNPELEYSVVYHDRVGKLVVAKDLVASLSKTFGLPEGEALAIVTTMKGADLLGTTYSHPLYDRKSPVLAGGDYITTESGTGLVHTAPGHGQEDYMTGLKYGLDILSPVDDVGCFTVEAGARFQGLEVLGEGNQAIIDALEEERALLKAEDYGHKYPYDWRTKKPTIFRATDQWFASVEGFREDALAAIELVHWIPDVGKNRIKSFVTGRGDWCISRQRSWGVPIPVFYDRATGNKVLLNESTLDHIQKLFAEHGSDCWWKLDEADLLPKEYIAEAGKWIKGTDTMDVWFDSGSSWAGVARDRGELQYPADMYLEGSDQHRGWFQSSLLTSVANNNQAPYKAVLTHGFVLDEKGLKMSKSLGNVVDPKIIIEGGNNKKLQPAYGADVLRLWVANSDYSGDVLIGDNIIKQTFEIYRKLRNTARYMIGTLADFKTVNQEGSNAVAYDDLPSLDRWMLGRLSQTLKLADESMEQYQFQRAIQELLRFATSDLSNFYLDVAKDRLYISAIDDWRRRSCQTVIQMCLEGFARAIAPLLPHMAEDVWQYLPYPTLSESVFEAGWPTDLVSFPEYHAEQWEFVRLVRDDVNKMLESARNDKLVGASLDAAAYIYAPDDSKRELLQGLVGDEHLVTPSVETNGVDELRTVLMLSQIHVIDSEEELLTSCSASHISDRDTMSGCIVGVKKADGEKCGRCWFYDKQVGKLGLPHNDACQRCNEAIFAWEKQGNKSFVRCEMEIAAEPVQ
ncbi:hypothetical protein MPSEU_000652800 [Mayamaea pseudoterrestris]|nr:hypothetical protein MPSEU_000652800 [Mayamaea pseudoterrestris]